jgi:hypothetical protein
MSLGADVPIAAVSVLGTAVAVAAGVRLWRDPARAASLVFFAAAAAAAGGFWTLVFYPALLSPDSLSSWEQALTGRYTDWQPPIMALLMRLVIALVGPDVAVYTFLQAWGFYLGAFALVAALTRPQPSPRRARVRLLSALLFLLWPVGWVFAATVWKDVLFALAASLLVASLLRFLGGGARADALAALASLAFALATRHNAIVLVPPAAVALHVGLARAKASRLGRWGAVALLAMALALPAALDAAVDAGQTERGVVPASLLLGYDQTLERTAGRTHGPSETFWNETLGEGGYRGVMTRAWGCGDEWTFLLDPGVDKSRVREAAAREPYRVLGVLADLVAREPGAIVRHHLCVIAKLVGASPPSRVARAESATAPAGYQVGIAANDRGFVPSSRFPATRAAALGVIGALFDGGLCRHWVSLGLLAAMLVAGLTANDDARALAIAPRLGLSRDALVVVPAFGLSYAAGYALVPIAYDWRYLFFDAVLAAVVISAVVAQALVGRMTAAP